MPLFIYLARDSVKWIFKDMIVLAFLLSPAHI